MDIIRVSMLGIAGILLCFMLKELRPEYALFVSFGVGLLILAAAVTKMEYLFESLWKIQSYLPIENQYLTVILKMLGISYIGQFSSGICKDAGYSSLGNQLELFGKLAIMAVSMPILLALLETINEFWQ